MATFDPAALTAFENLLRLIDGISDPAEKVKRLSEAFKDLNASQLEQIRSSISTTAETNKAIDARERQIEVIKLSAQAQQSMAEADRAAAQRSGDKLQAIKAEEKAREALIETLKAQRAAETDPEEIERLSDAIQEKTISLREYRKETEQTKKSTDELQQSIKSLAKEFGNIGKAAFAGEEAGKQFSAAIGGIGNTAIESIQKKLVSSFGRAGPPMAAFVGIAATAAEAMIKLAVEMANTSAQIQKTTGVSESFANSIVSGFEETREFGGSLKELSGATEELSKTFTDFTMMSDEAARSLAVTATMMDKLGVSNSDFAKGIQLSTKALGMTVEQAEDSQLRLAALAMDIGVAPSQMASNFAAAAPQLAKFGKDGEQAFKSLAITAKSTGIEVGRLLQITEKFDTFEGAAEQAGKLNAALGGNFVNAMEMLTETDPTARFEMMTDAIKDAGLSFDDMSYFQRKFYADAMGLQDVSELALAMSGNTELLGEEAGKTAAEYEAMAKRAADVQSLQEQLNIVFADMVPILMPMVEGLGEVVKIMRENKEVVQAFAITFGVLGTSVFLATLPLNAMVLSIAAIVTAIGAAVYIIHKKRNSPVFGKTFEYLAGQANMFTTALDAMREPFGFLSDDIDGINKKMHKPGGLTANLNTTTKTMHQLDTTTMRTAQTARAAAPVLANSTAISRTMQNYNTTNNNTTNNGGGGNVKVEIGVGDEFSSMFTAKVKQAVSNVGFRGLLD